MKLVQSGMKMIGELYRDACVSLSTGIQRHSVVILAILGVAVLQVGLLDNVFAQGGDTSRYKDACNRLLALIEGPFGALVTTAAGIGAIIASALGGFKIAWVLVVTAVGAFILRSYITLFFAAC